MEEAILKTLIYADLFDYPLKAYEIHRWLIGKKANLRQVEKALKKLCQVSSIEYQGEYYFLPKRNKLVAQRRRKGKQSAIYLRKAKILSQVLKMIPWIKLVGISGGLALDNAGKKDDIDLFIITGKRYLWLSRFLALGLLSLIGQRRKNGEMGRKVAGKLCINILLEEDRLEQTNKDIFVAHEVLQMKVLWQRNRMYSKYLEDNAWAFKFLPNWVETGTTRLATKNNKRDLTGSDFVAHVVDLLEKLAKKLQLKIMQQPKGMERIEDGALYFHPQDCRLEILKKYKLRLNSL